MATVAGEPRGLDGSVELSAEPSIARRKNHAEEIRILRALLVQQETYSAARPDCGACMEYLRAHFGMDITLRRHLRVVDLLMPYIGGRILEWGCQYAPDACLYRMRCGEGVELDGCDIVPEKAYRPFYEFSGIRYRRVEHPYRLDYPHDTFDVVTSNGVLEHVPDDWRSVQEVFRVLKPGGTFLITCLPNRWSYTEAMQRWRDGPYHDRLYTSGAARRMLRQAGFDITTVRYLFMLPTMLCGFPARLKAAYQRADRVIRIANWVLEHLWPVNRLASNLMIVARKPNMPTPAPGESA
jgi:SAM-dependent methyltransferase